MNSNTVNFDLILLIFGIQMLNFTNNNIHNEGQLRTVLDVGCGVASFGGYLLSSNVIAMSLAPNDVHQNQIQFALERGIPAYLGVLGTKRLPYPSRSFELAHCSRFVLIFLFVGCFYVIVMVLCDLTKTRLCSCMSVTGLTYTCATWIMLIHIQRCVFEHL